MRDYLGMSLRECVVWLLLFVLSAVAVNVLCGVLKPGIRTSDDERCVKRDIVRVVVYDTVRVSCPVVRDSVVVRYDTVRVSLGDDRVGVVLPVEQRVYEDSIYTAYVSGYRSSLDSLILRLPREITTLTNTHYQKPKRWSIGVHAGYGLRMKGTPQFAPYVGVGVSYNLFSF